jgi:pSer/pThr/pTyr-binding forkhead associated (FHA) protein
VTSVYSPTPANPANAPTRASAPNPRNLTNLSPPATLKAIELAGGPEGMVTLHDGVHTIGRQATATVRLAEGDREGSRIHAALTIAGQRVTIEDRSANGTFVNDERVKEPRALRDGDKVRCGGSTFTVRFVR